MADRSKGPEHIKNLLGRFIRKNQLGGKLGNREIYAVWPEIVGPDIASHTRVTAFRKGVLSVAVDSAAHFYELSAFFAEEIRGKINRHGLKRAVTKINFHLE
jgi:predicted nucleic acid-binding Zn ribbon protein